MNKIPSFTIDHERLLRGIYVSRKDEVGNETVTTFDIRMKEPNREPVLHVGAIHAIEHLAATFLRNDPEWKDRVIYWGPMGCLTGNYLILRGDLASKDIVDLMRRTFQFVADFEGDIPGAAPRDCGNYLLHDLPMAKWESRKFLTEVLNNITDANLNYPEKEEWGLTGSVDELTGSVDELTSRQVDELMVSVDELTSRQVDELMVSIGELTVSVDELTVSVDKLTGQ